MGRVPAAPWEGLAAPAQEADRGLFIAYTSREAGLLTLFPLVLRRAVLHWDLHGHFCQCKMCHAWSSLRRDTAELAEVSAVDSTES